MSPAGVAPDTPLSLEAMPETPDRVGRNVKEQRERAGLSLAQLAAVTGISKAHLVRLENKPANPSLEILGRIAEALGVTVADLVGGPKLTYSSASDEEVPSSLKAFAEDAGLSSDEVQTLASIRFRGGDRPRTAKRWGYIYDSLNLSKSLDGDRNDFKDLD
jgi:transcriptional regulator with XRE-family HTH domain